MTRQDSDDLSSGLSGRAAMDRNAAAAFFARVSRDLMEEQAETPTMLRIAERAVQVVPACDHCGISMRRRRHRVESVAATSTLAEKCDALQYEFEEGPCLEAVWHGEFYLTEDTSKETRWPRWAPRVAEQGIGSVLSIRLSTQTETLGALNLYAEEKDAYGTDDIDLAVIYALHAANAMNSAVLLHGLQTAVQSRHMIGVAQGILMQNYGISMEQSFELLRRYSSYKNIKLREVAEHVVQAGDLPEVRRPPN
jgi:transcriptional regulator with GAF, ATPase, and Fis domain